MFNRLILLLIFAFSFDFYADEVDGLPELASEKEKRKIFKIYTPSTKPI